MWSFRIFLLLLFVGFLVLFVRLIDISLIRGSYYQTLAEENRIRRIPLYAPRGKIIDRNGVVLASNDDEERMVRFEEGKASYFLDSSKDKYDEVKDLVILRPKRTYPSREITAHVIGYVGEVGKDEVEKSGCIAAGKSTVYSLGDMVGRLGVEETFDCELRGQNGEELVEVNTKGKKIRILGKSKPIPGNNVVSSIDSKLQKRALEALKGQKGAVVALKPQTGEILALVSSPSYDPNTLNSQFKNLNSNQDLPMFNRAIGGAYPPGSIFKIVTSAAGLEEEKINENFRFVDQGFIQIGAFTFRNWYFTKFGGTEGEIDLVKAIARSTDTFFYKVGELVGVEQLAQWAQKFGLGNNTGIELAGEVAGNIPTPEWKERVRGERWFLGNTYHMSIGQGDITTTPLQIASMTSVIANGGKWCKPTIKKFEYRISNIETSASWRTKPQKICKEIGLSEKTVDLIRKGMEAACSPGGTSLRFINFEVPNHNNQLQKIHISCKTGTAELAATSVKTKDDETHAWFTTYASRVNQDGTLEEPEIVVTVLVERGGEGSTAAAPIAKEVLEEWFKR